MPAARTSPTDVTGRRKAELAKEHAEELAARAKEMTLMTQAEEEAKKAPVDLTQQPQPEPEIRPVAVKPQTKNLRVNTELIDVTIGQGNYYTFEVGREYIVPEHVYEHLDGLGYVWH